MLKYGDKIMAEEQTVKTEEQGTAAATDQAEAKPNKKKKINDFSLAEINTRIGEIELTKQTQSKYYQHLVNRRNELQPK